MFHVDIKNPITWAVALPARIHIGKKLDSRIVSENLTIHVLRESEGYNGSDHERF